MKINFSARFYFAQLFSKMNKSKQGGGGGVKPREFWVNVLFERPLSR